MHKAIVVALMFASTSVRAQEMRHVATDAQEIALGAALAATFDADRGLVPTNPQNTRIQAYLQSVADSLGAHTRRRLPWTIHYDPHPGIHSGFALPGGHIVIWGGVLSYMTTEDELAAILAHEIAHIDDDQVSARIDSLVKATGRDVGSPAQWQWDEFGASYGSIREKRCDYDGAALMVRAGYSPVGVSMLLQSFVALAGVHAPTAPPPRAIVERIEQIHAEIVDRHWQALTRTRPLHVPMSG
jgi:predicted Zn-dependent protease